MKIDNQFKRKLRKEERINHYCDGEECLRGIFSNGVPNRACVNFSIK
ncbi:MAG: hypothetical protein JXQ23_06515 [Clostridia bacterium]|nr:hypothetical protein [Clostridia bacterium]